MQAASPPHPKKYTQTQPCLNPVALLSFKESPPRWFEEVFLHGPMAGFKPSDAPRELPSQAFETASWDPLGLGSKGSAAPPPNPPTKVLVHREEHA